MAAKPVPEGSQRGEKPELLDTLVGEPLPVHDCMGVSLWVDGQPWGVLTLDALQTGTFGEASPRITTAVRRNVRPRSNMRMAPAIEGPRDRCAVAPMESCTPRRLPAARATTHVRVR